MGLSKLMHAVLAFCLCCVSTGFAEICGKADAGIAYVHVDVLESGKTVKKMDMGAFKGDATIVVWKGLCFKPTLLAGTGEGEILSTGLGIGHVTPVNDWLTVTPSAGVLYTYLRTKIDLPMFGLFHLTERFSSVSPYISLDATVSLPHGFRICGQVQYAWSTTDTHIDHLPKSKSHCAGPSYALMLEYDLNDSWSLQLGGAYNISLSKEKHGLRGAGVKIGAAYWF